MLPSLVSLIFVKVSKCGGLGSMTKWAGLGYLISDTFLFLKKMLRVIIVLYLIADNYIVIVLVCIF